MNDGTFLLNPRKRGKKPPPMYKQVLSKTSKQTNNNLLHAQLNVFSPQRITDCCNYPVHSWLMAPNVRLVLSTPNVQPRGFAANYVIGCFNTKNTSDSCCIQRTAGSFHTQRTTGSFHTQNGNVLFALKCRTASLHTMQLVLFTPNMTTFFSH